MQSFEMILNRMCSRRWPIRSVPIPFNCVSKPKEYLKVRKMMKGNLSNNSRVIMVNSKKIYCFEMKYRP